MSGEVESIGNDSSNAQSTSQSQLNSYTAKVAELFYTASNAFNKLGEITFQLNASNVDPDENRWSETEMDGLKNALLRFANDLESVSESLLVRSKLMIRKDIKRRTLQLGNEIGGGATMGGASRTMFRPANIKMEQNVYTETVTTSTDPSEQPITENAGPSQDSLSPLSQEEPPILTPAEIPVRKEQIVPSSGGPVRRFLPTIGTGGTTLRRVPISAANRPISQSIRLVNTTPGTQQVIRNRIMPSSNSNLTGTQQYPANRHIPYARVSTNSPQLVSASKTRLIPTSNVPPSSNNESNQWGSHQWRR